MGNSPSAEIDDQTHTLTYTCPVQNTTTAFNSLLDISGFLRVIATGYNAILSLKQGQDGQIGAVYEIKTLNENNSMEITVHSINRDTKSIEFTVKNMMLKTPRIQTLTAKVEGKRNSEKGKVKIVFHNEPSLFQCWFFLFLCCFPFFMIYRESERNSRMERTKSMLKDRFENFNQPTTTLHNQHQEIDFIPVAEAVGAVAVAVAKQET